MNHVQNRTLDSLLLPQFFSSQYMTTAFTPGQNIEPSFLSSFDTLHLNHQQILSFLSSLNYPKSYHFSVSLLLPLQFKPPSIQFLIDCNHLPPGSHFPPCLPTFNPLHSSQGDPSKAPSRLCHSPT